MRTLSLASPAALSQGITQGRGRQKRARSVERPARAKTRPRFHPLPPRVQLREFRRDREARPFEIGERRHERDIAKTELIREIVASGELTLEIREMALRFT